MPLPFEAHPVVAVFLQECNNVPKSTTTKHWLVARLPNTGYESPQCWAGYGFYNSQFSPVLGGY